MREFDLFRVSELTIVLGNVLGLNELFTEHFFYLFHHHAFLFVSSCFIFLSSSFFLLLRFIFHLAKPCRRQHKTGLYL